MAAAQKWLSSGKCKAKPQMNTWIGTLSIDDLPSVDALMKSNSATLGFLPYEALEDYHHRGGLLGAKTADNKLIGYLLYSINHSYFRIAHLCVSEEYRGKKIAKRFIQHLRNKATTQSLVKLRCRRDYAANAMWPALGFIPIDEKPGRSSAGHHLTLWCLTLAPNQQLELFQALTLNENLNAVIDAQVFLTFTNPRVIRQYLQNPCYPIFSLTLSTSGLRMNCLLKLIAKEIPTSAKSLESRRMHSLG